LISPLLLINNRVTLPKFFFMSKPKCHRFVAPQHKKALFFHKFL
jgi:hypothetical protein